MYEDDAENARAALRALWSASGQLDSADTLGQEQEFDSRAAGNDGKGGEGGYFGSDRHKEVGLQDFGATNEPTFDRGEAATKLRDAWRSTLTAEGKMGSDGSMAKAARKTTERVRSGIDPMEAERESGDVDPEESVDA